MQSLLDVCIESVGELIRSNFGKEVLYEVVNMNLCYIFTSFTNLLPNITFLENSMDHAGCNRGFWWHTAPNFG